jgi:hypothetical protein
MQKVLLIAKWFFGITYILIGFGVFEDSILMSILAVLLGLFIIPVTFQLFEKVIKKNIHRAAKWAIAIGGGVAFTFLMSSIRESKDNEAKELIAKAYEQMSADKIDDAATTLKTISPDSKELKDSIGVLLFWVNHSRSVDAAQKIVESMTDEEFDKLESGTLDKDYIKQPGLNKHFISLIASNKNKRAEFKAKAEQAKVDKINKSIEEIESHKKDILTLAKKTFIASHEDQVKLILSLIEGWGAKVTESEASTVPEINQAGKELKKVLVSYQVKQFPHIRRSLAEIMKDKMWEHDVEISSSGRGATTITIVGAYFAANKNIKQIQESISDLLHNARFKRAEYKWYSGQDEYDYYRMDSKKDSEI